MNKEYTPEQILEFLLYFFINKLHYSLAETIMMLIDYEIVITDDEVTMIPKAKVNDNA